MTQLCLFSPVGCKVELLSNAVKKHNEKCVAIHLGYTFEALQKEEEKSSKLQELVEKLAKENEELKEVSIPKLLEIVEKLQRGNGEMQEIVQKLQESNGEMKKTLVRLTDDLDKREGERLAKEEEEKKEAEAWHNLDKPPLVNAKFAFTRWNVDELSVT